MEKSKKRFNVKEYPILKLKLPEGFEFEDASPKEILSIICLDNSGKYKHDYTHFICRFCYYNNLTFEDFISWYKNKSTEDKRIQKYKIHWDNVSNFPKVRIIDIKYLLMRFYPSIRNSKTIREFKNLFDLSKYPIKKIDILSGNIFNENNKFDVLNIGMGAGKTKITIEYLNSLNSYLWITPNMALSQNTYTRIIQEEVLKSDKCKHYQEDFKTKESKENIQDANKLIICLNSLKYITYKIYYVIIIYEI